MKRFIAFGLSCALASGTFAAPSQAETRITLKLVGDSIAANLNLATQLDPIRAQLAADAAAVTKANVDFYKIAHPKLPVVDSEKLINQVEDLIVVNGSLAKYCTPIQSGASIKLLVTARHRQIKAYRRFLDRRLSSGNLSRKQEKKVKSMVKSLRKLRAESAKLEAEQIQAACASFEFPKLQTMLADMKATFGLRYTAIPLFDDFQAGIAAFNTKTLNQMKNRKNAITNIQNKLANPNSGLDLGEIRSDLFAHQQFLNGTFRYVYCTAEGRAADSFMAIEGANFAAAIETHCAESALAVDPAVTEVRALLALVMTAAGI